MDISFVIPTLNEANHIESTLRELASFREFSALKSEIIVVDGRSSDGTASLSRRLADHVIQEPPGRGTIARARNLGARRASGTVLVHMDADSRIPFVHELMSESLQAVTAGTWVAAVPRLMPYPWEQTPLDIAAHWSMNALTRALMPFGAWFAKGECQVMSRETFDLVGGYNDALVLGEDCELFGRLARAGNVVQLRRHKVFHSTRRFRATGYSQVFRTYALQAFALIVLRRNWVHQWDVVR